MQTALYILILALGAATYASATIQMLRGHYSPSFFSRAVWFLLGIVSFAGVLLGDGSTASVILAGTLFAGNLAVFAVSYKKGSREFGVTEKISLALLVVSVLSWLLLDSAFISLTISLIAHFIGGLPTYRRAYLKPESENALHWYLFFAASVVSIIASPDKSFVVILFPLYFAVFDGLIILLANRQRLVF